MKHKARDHPSKNRSLMIAAFEWSKSVWFVDLFNCKFYQLTQEDYQKFHPTLLILLIHQDTTKSMTDSGFDYGKIVRGSWYIFTD